MAEFDDRIASYCVDLCGFQNRKGLHSGRSINGKRLKADRRAVGIGVGVDQAVDHADGVHAHLERIALMS